jgi:membrane-bound lytic murein transglycosylase D
VAAEVAPDSSKVILEGEVLTRDPNIVYHREEILNDYSERISKEFAIPAGLRDRVGFWFDIYTRYDQHNRVIHHSEFPWIIFKVVDVTDIINSDKPKFRWMRNMKADDAVSAEFKKIRQALKEIAAGSKYNDANPYHQSVKTALEPLKGTLRKKARVAYEKIRVQTGQKNFFASGLQVSPRYLPGMEEIFRAHKLPTELTRLPFVESSFNKHATSKVGASGIWQFMDYTGKNFMTVNDRIDERRSPFKATVAAARLLKENHLILRRSWPMALTAWNHGPSGIRKAAKAAGSTDLAEIIARYQSKNFDFASSNFYCEFLAALYAEKYHDEIFKDLEYEKALDLHAVKLAKKVQAKELLRMSGLTAEDFVSYNPDLEDAIQKNHQIPSGFTFMVDTPSRVVLKGLLTKESQTSTAKVSQSDVSLNDPVQN